MTHFGPLQSAPLPTRYPSLDALLRGGLRCGELTVLAGDVGSGKTALALGFAVRMAKAGVLVTVATTEGPASRVIARTLAMELQCDLDDVLRGISPTLERQEYRWVRELFIAHEPSSRAPITTLVHLSGGIDGLLAHTVDVPAESVLIVDALGGLVRSGALQNPDAETAASIARLKQIAVDRNIAVLLLATPLLLDRSRADLRPELWDLGTGGVLQEVADVVLTLYRAEMYTKDPTDAGATELHVRKSRDGALGYADLYFTATCVLMQDVADPDV
jgi:replicative DNA helicase